MLYPFQEQADKRGLDLEARKQEANVRFCEYMQSVTQQPYAVQAVVFWSIEQAYCQVCMSDRSSMTMHSCLSYVDGVRPLNIAGLEKCYACC